MPVTTMTRGKWRLQQIVGGHNNDNNDDNNAVIAAKGRELSADAAITTNGAIDTKQQSA